MLLEPSGAIFINELARDRLKVVWGDAYGPNMQTLIPSFARQLRGGVLSVHGVKTLQPGMTLSKTVQTVRQSRWH